MAREIHDTLAQGLTGIITQVQAARNAEDRPADWRRHLDNAADLARDSLTEARRTSGPSAPSRWTGPGSPTPWPTWSSAGRA